MHAATSQALLDELEKISKARWMRELEAGTIAPQDLPAPMQAGATQHVGTYNKDPASFARGQGKNPTNYDASFAENVRDMRYGGDLKGVGAKPFAMDHANHGLASQREEFGALAGRDIGVWGGDEARRSGGTLRQWQQSHGEFSGRPETRVAPTPAAPAAPVHAPAPAPHPAPAPVHAPAATTALPHAPAAAPHAPTPTTGLASKVQGMSLGKKVGIGAGLVGAAALGGYALHKHHQAQQAQTPRHP